MVSANEADGKRVAYPDTLVGTDPHTTMINGSASWGWGVGGSKAEAAMWARLFDVDSGGSRVKLTGRLREANRN